MVLNPHETDTGGGSGQVLGTAGTGGVSRLLR